MKYLKAIGAALIAFLAFLAAAQATKQRARAKGALDASEDELKATVETGTDEAQAAAQRALEHLDKAKAAEQRATELVSRGVSNEPTLADVTDKWRARSVRSKPAAK
jgi:hypothetical protein